MDMTTPPLPRRAEDNKAARAKNAGATREVILAAARRRFLAESYESVGLRDVAGDAGVDVALVSRYFGSKEGLFEEVLGRCGDACLPPDLPAADLPAFLTELFMEEDDAGHREHAERLLILLRSASSPKAAEIVRDALRDDILNPLAERLSGDDAKLRASLSMAVWMGVTMLRTIMTVEPISRGNRDLIKARLARLHEAALSEI